jgi:purine-binding chemotaxis protein CheW
MSERASRMYLIVRMKNCVCALPLENVIETMRPLAIEEVAGAPEFLRGVSLIRGIATPVIDLDAMLGRANPGAGRIVTMNCRGRQIGLLVEGVMDVRDLGMIAAEREFPALLRSASRECVAKMDCLDGELLVILRKGWRVPEEVWEAIETEAAR